MFITFSTPLKIRHEKVLHDLIQTAQLHNLNLAIHSFLKAYHIVFFFYSFLPLRKIKSLVIQLNHHTWKCISATYRKKLFTAKAFILFLYWKKGNFLHSCWQFKTYLYSLKQCLMKTDFFSTWHFFQTLSLKDESLSVLWE